MLLSFPSKTDESEHKEIILKVEVNFRRLILIRQINFCQVCSINSDILTIFIQPLEQFKVPSSKPWTSESDERPPPSLFTACQIHLFRLSLFFDDYLTKIFKSNIFVYFWKVYHCWESNWELCGKKFLPILLNVWSNLFDVKISTTKINHGYVVFHGCCWSHRTPYTNKQASNQALVSLCFAWLIEMEWNCIRQYYRIGNVNISPKYVTYVLEKNGEDSFYCGW